MVEYGMYVWSAYLITGFLLCINIISAIRGFRKISQSIKGYETTHQRTS